MEEPTYIGEGCELVGELRFKDAVRIDGQVGGEIRTATTIIVGKPARIAAGIEAESVIVYGTVEGNIRAKRNITLQQSARVTGEIQTTRFVIEEGAHFNGRIIMGKPGAA